LDSVNGQSTEIEEFIGPTAAERRLLLDARRAEGYT
jgi:hypothetical protein